MAGRGEKPVNSAGKNDAPNTPQALFEDMQNASSSTVSGDFALGL